MDGGLGAICMLSFAIGAFLPTVIYLAVKRRKDIKYMKKIIEEEEK